MYSHPRTVEQQRRLFGRRRRVRFPFLFVFWGGYLLLLCLGGFVLLGFFLFD